MQKTFLLLKAGLFYIVFLYFSIELHAQNTRISDENTNAWLMYFGDHNLTNKWGLHTEAQARRAEAGKTWQQLLLRGGFNYNLSKNTMATLGYAFVQTFPYGDFPAAESFPENRIYEQLQFKNKEGIFTFIHRYRQEQRWVTPPNQLSSVYTNRSRYFFKTTLPIANKQGEDNGFYLAAYDEIFINFGKNVQQNIFDQNRLYFAAGYKLNKNSALEAGYLNQVVQKANGKIFEYNHTLQFGITYNIDFTAAEK